MKTCQLYLYPCGFAGLDKLLSKKWRRFELTHKQNKLTQGTTAKSCCAFSAFKFRKDGFTNTSYIDKSERITEGVRNSFQSADCKMENRSCFGYNTTSSDGLTINEVESEIVRWIFRRFLAGDSLGKIAAGLQKQNMPSPSGKPRWNRQAISKLLSNEKYTGSVLLQKKLSVCGTQFKNEGELEQILIRNHHEAIILAEDFTKVQRIKNEHTVKFQRGCL